MGLEGTIRDFALSDIFQLIGMQRKTGTLTLEDDRDRVSVKFVEGCVVEADTRLRNLEDLLGSVLVRTGRMAQSQLEEALRIQRATLQRLGHILVKERFISEEDLQEALRIQVMQIVYRLFRWRDGRFSFLPEERVDYDRHFTPVRVETILMEGARMVDEWPILERRIRSERMVFQKTEAARALEGPVESLVDADIDFGFGEEGEAKEGKKREGIRLSAEERDVLRLVDGRVTVQEIVDRSPLSEFDVYRCLYELLNRNLLQEIKPILPAGTARRASLAQRVARHGATAAVLALALLSLMTLPSNPLTPWKVSSAQGATDRLRFYASRARVEGLETALRVHYLDRGSLPQRLAGLSAGRFVAPRDILDPWGRPYEYHLAAGGYRLAGLDADGRPAEALTVNRRFGGAEQRILPTMEEPPSGSFASAP